MNQNFEYFQISQKSRYAIRALLQLALLDSREPVGVKKLADAQDIPSRFLEVILSELRQGGFVLSVRGKRGGYMLAHQPRQVTIGQIIRFVESVQNKQFSCDGIFSQRIKAGDFSENWLFNQINGAISEILDGVTLEELIRKESAHKAAYVENYVI